MRKHPHSFVAIRVRSDVCLTHRFMPGNHSPVTPLQLELKASPAAYALVILPHFVALLILLIPELILTDLSERTSITIPVALKFSLLLLVLVSLFYYWMLYLAKRLKQSVIELSQHADGSWSVRTVGDAGHSAQHPVEILGSSFVSPFLIIVRARRLPTNGKAIFTVLIPPDSLDKTAFRRLRVRLRVIKQANL